MAYGAAGTVITGSPPACRVFNSAAISIATSGTIQVLTFDSERFKNQAALHSTSVNTSRITISDPGVYMVTAGIEFANNVTGSRLAIFKLNGTTFLNGLEVPAAVGTETTVLTISTIWKFAANDFIEVWAKQTSGGALNVTANPSVSAEFGVCWMGLGT